MIDTISNVIEVADNLYRIQLPMPFELKHINTYLIKETNRLGLVDCGLDLPDSWAALDDGIRSLGIAPSDLTDIFVTHAHPDHIGQLAHLRELAPQARVFLHRREYTRLAERFADLAASQKILQTWFDHNGAPELSGEQLARGAYETPPHLQEGDLLLDGGERIVLNPTDKTAEWQVMWTPGHTPGHMVLFHEERGLMLSGDHLLTSISSNIGKYPSTTDDPLGDFISSLQRIDQLSLTAILPAHGEVFGNYHERIAHLIRHHEERLAKIHATLEGEPKTAMQVADKIWGKKAVGFHRYLALFEACSHLERLLRQGDVVTEDDGKLLLYRAA